MNKQIKLLRNNDKKDWNDVEWVDEFYKFMQGENPESIKCDKLDLTSDKAFTIIWYLQEHFSIIPDNIEKCSECNDLYDSYSQGYYSEKEGTHHCECSADEAWYKDNPVEQEY